MTTPGAAETFAPVVLPGAAIAASRASTFGAGISLSASATPTAVVGAATPIAGPTTRTTAPTAAAFAVPTIASAAVIFPYGALYVAMLLWG